MFRNYKLLFATIYALLIQLKVCRDIVFNPNPMTDLNIFKLRKQNTYLSAISEDNQFAFISARDGGVFVASLANMIQPTIISNIPTLQSQYLYVKKDVLFIGDLIDGLLIYNISNAYNPVLISKWQVYLHIQAVVATQDLKYAFALGNGIVFCIDITDLKNPKTISKNGVQSSNSLKMRLSTDETHLCVSNLLYGLQIIDIRQKQNMIVRVNQNPVFVIWDFMFTPDQNSVYAVDAYYGLFQADVKQIFQLPEASKDLVNLKFIPIYSSPQAQESVDMTSDGLFLILGLRSIGLILFKIENQNYQSPVFVQRINSFYLSNNVYFSKNNNEAYLFVTNGLSLQIFKQVTINTNKDFPNIYNTFQSSLTHLSPAYFPWQIICLSNSKYIIETNSNYGLKIFNIQDNYLPKLESSIPIIKGEFGGIQVNQQLDILYVGAQQDGLLIYNISDVSNVQLINQFTPLDPHYFSNAINGVTYNQKNNFIVVSSGYYGFSVLNVTSESTVQQIGIFINKQFACSFEKCQITNDTTTIICACREIGLIFFDFTNQKLQQSYLLAKLGAEYLILSQNDKYAFVCFGFMGLLIADIQNKYSPKILSVQPLDGWAQSVMPIFNERYLLVTQIEKGYLVVVNIEDLQNPYIQSKLQFPNENCNSVCITPDQHSAYMIGNSGLRYIPLDTNLVLHTQIQVQQLDEKGNIFYQDLAIGQSLQVGQMAQVFFVPLFIQSQVKIQNAYYYRNFQMQVLPFWITFYSQTQNLEIQVDKTGAVNTFSNEVKGENIIVLQCLISLNSDNFITPNINKDLSQQIYTSLVNQGYLDNQGYLTPKLDPTIIFNLDFFDNSSFTEANVGTPQQIQQIQNDIKQVLVFSQVQYPIRFFVQSSLFFNYQNVTANTTNSIISTPSLQINVLIQIVSQGKFVKRQLDGVIASFSDDQTSLQIQGQTQYVNQIIGQNLQISNFTQNLTECILEFIISDSSNYEISKQIPLSNLSFINIYSPIEVFQQNNLQIQFNKQFANGNLQVESRFQFAFDISTFKQKDNLPITYKAYIVEIDGSLTQITTGSWIEFNDFNLGFSGQKTISAMFSSYRVRIVAADSYSTVYDEFVFEFTQIPFLYVVQLIIQIVGPILGIFGIWKYRSEIYTFFMERFYLYSNECAIVGEVYKKQIILMNEVWEETEKLWKLFISINKGFGNKLLQEYKKEKTINLQSVINRLFQVYTEYQKKFPNIDHREFEFDDSRLTRVVKRFCYEFILQKDKNTKKILNHLKKIGSKTYRNKDWYKQFAIINYKFEVSNNKVVLKNSKENQDVSKSPQLLQRQNSKLNQIDSQNISLDLKKEISFKSNDQEKINEQNGQTDRNSIQNVLKQRSNEFTSNNVNTKDQIAEFDSYGLKMAPLSNPQSQHMLYSPRINMEDNLIDLKREDNLTLDEEEDEENLNPFPEIIIKTDLIQFITNTQYPNLNFDMQLLKEIMILEISGIEMGGPNRINPTTGESLHLFSHQLLSVEAFKRDNEDTTCYCFKKFFKANYSPIGLNQNNPLPQWLNCQIINGIIHIWGTPKSNDEPEILVKIVDQLTFTILSYHLYIKDKEGIDLKDKRKSTIFQTNKTNLDANQNSKKMKSKKLPQNQITSQGSQISQQNIYESQRENKIKGYITSRLSRFSKDLSASQRLQINQAELLKNQTAQQQIDKEFDSSKQQKSDSNTEQEVIFAREQPYLENLQINQQCNRLSSFKKDQIKNQNDIQSKMSNQIEEDKTIDEEEERGRDYDETPNNGNQMSQQVAITNYQAGK
ncbi:hypothetical protein TTHERM_00046100 (macronuclear) [Tetrahymena thermophila SB210]|uniref:Transmembrane protein n=1 Tax=Tetrahymena thermophila (strain SB210) TaxID=312017 RepID=Q23DT1_TETTS|nr:hypothetical protein TTHERM_00046100 [Tetrahymena thermophila SB210]EAR94417.2 hypothetical protein TTHERM_00046100 [Tetrahymena thermophila SB210]|eukprot:XP_001014605.2 hypothetical protein TTHERM_00046100 [Tetrahymena thermophila SB210]